MKKIILALAVLISPVFAINLEKYFTPKEIQIINSYLEKYHQKLAQQPIKKQCEKYNQINQKIQIALQKQLPKKIKVLILYIQEQVQNWQKICKIPQATTWDIITWTNQDKIQINLNNEYFKKNSILVPISGTAYTIYWVNLKSLYQDAFVKSLLIKNVYGNIADSLIKKAYLISVTGQVLQQTNFVNWYAYFELPKPFKLFANVNTPFYVAISLNEPKNWNTNKPIKLVLTPQTNWFQTLIVSAINWENIPWLVSNNFASYNYLIRKSKPLISNSLYRWNLKAGTYKIYSLTLNTTWGTSKLLQLNLDLSISKAYIDTGSFLLKINWQKYPYVKFYFPDISGNGKLKLRFNNPYDITTGTNFDIYATFTRVPDHSTVYCQLREISDFTWTVDGNYTGSFSILYSDNAARFVDINTKDWFTDTYLDFSKVYSWTLRKK